MHKKWLVLIILTAFILSLFGCAQEEHNFPPELIQSVEVPENPPNYEIPEEFMEHFALVDAAVKEINATSDFGEYKLLQIDDYSILVSRVENYNGEDGSSWYAGLYPYESGIPRIVSIGIESSKYHLYGFRVGDDIKDMEHFLIEKGFEITKDWKSGEKGQKTFDILGDAGISILIKYDTGTGILQGISISVHDPTNFTSGAIY